MTCGEVRSKFAVGEVRVKSSVCFGRCCQVPTLNLCKLSVFQQYFEDSIDNNSAVFDFKQQDFDNNSVVIDRNNSLHFDIDCVEFDNRFVLYFVKFNNSLSLHFVKFDNIFVVHFVLKFNENFVLQFLSIRVQFDNSFGQHFDVNNCFSDNRKIFDEFCAVKCLGAVLGYFTTDNSSDLTKAEVDTRLKHLAR
ncbi:hypothetical protein LSTR_LSTR012814 [Laodelphax striatellus]|uniref:Uncharacterized protein n=1 Tax=Laodelphax striatellus TaxID=195883 RepID=A0A482WT65_LAOST|nr:hypothetical protein LSTR_LSTR012814 [Laodelphax striatellus]